MSKRSDLKKDVNHLTFSVINECYAFLDFSPEGNYENVMDIIFDAVDLRNKLIYRINHTKELKSKKEVKEYFKKIVCDLYENNIEFIDRLNSLGN